MLGPAVMSTRSYAAASFASLLLLVAPELCAAASLQNSDVVGLKLGMSPQQVAAVASKELLGYDIDEYAVSLGSSKLIFRQAFTRKSAGGTDNVIVFYSGDPDHSAVTSLIHRVSTPDGQHPISSEGRPLTFATLQAALKAKYQISQEGSEAFSAPASGWADWLRLLELDETNGAVTSKPIVYAAVRPKDAEMQLSEKVVAFYSSVPQIASAGVIQRPPGSTDTTYGEAEFKDLESELSKTADIDVRLVTEAQLFTRNQPNSPEAASELSYYLVSINSFRLYHQLSLDRVRFIHQFITAPVQPKL